MFLSPMLLEKREKPFDDERYIFEPKIDGHRMIISIENRQVRLYTRHRFDVTQQYPELHRVPIDDNSDAVLDGEVACIDPATGAIDFERIQERFMVRKPMAIRQAMVRLPVVFFAFDILRYKGEDLRGLPLIERKAILEQALDENPHFSKVISIEGAGLSMFEAIRKKRMEGIAAKLKTSKYAGRRDASWLKILNYQYAVCQIAGYRKRQFGWLLQYQDRPVGMLELGVPLAHKQAFLGVSKAIETGEDPGCVYVEPKINVRVRFRGWYRTGQLRAPEFVEFAVQ